jgi:ABC-2 type transport system permease protein
MAWRAVIRTARQPIVIVPPLVFPLFLLAINASGLDAATQIPGFPTDSYLAFALAFPFMQGAIFATNTAGTNIAQDIGSGFFNRLSLTPMRGSSLLAAHDRSAVIAGYGVAAVIRTVFVWAMVFAIALATGLEVNGGGVDLFGLVGLGLIVNVAAFLFAAGVMTRMRTLQAAPAMQLPVFFILMTSPVYVPRALLQGWIETVSQVNPATPIIEAGRSLMAGDPFHVALAFAAAVGLAAALSVFARRGLRKAEAAG